jgi:hypothetical protein
MSLNSLRVQHPQQIFRRRLLKRRLQICFAVRNHRQKNLEMEIFSTDDFSEVTQFKLKFIQLNHVSIDTAYLTK